MTLNVAANQSKFINDDVIAGYPNNAISISADDVIVIGRSANIFSASDFGILFSNVASTQSGEIENFGFIDAYGGIYLTGSQQNSGETITNSSAAIIEGSSFGISSDTPLSNISINNSGEIEAVATAINVQATTLSLLNSGAIDATTGFAAVLVGDSTILNSGSMNSLDDGILVQGDSSNFDNSGLVDALAFGVQFDGTNEYIHNSGKISVTGAEAVYVRGDNAKVFNSGTISAHANAVYVSGRSANIQNSGTISAYTDDIYISAPTGASSWIVNALGGVIEAEDDVYYAIYATGSAAHIANRGDIVGSIFAAGASTFLNTGSFYGGAVFSGAGIAVRNSGKMSFDGTGVGGDAGLYIGGAAGDDLFVNLAGGVVEASKGDSLSFATGGTLQAFNYGEMFGALSLSGQASLFNAGTITGNVLFGAAASLLTNRGAIVGDVHFASTGNVYRGQSGEVTGAIYGAGADGFYYGGSGDDRFDMTASSAAYVSGGAGDDSFIFTVAGLTAKTWVVGGDGTDALTFTTAGTFSASAFAHVSGIETINLAAGFNTLTLSNALVGSAANASLTVNGGLNADKISAAAVTTATDTITIYGLGGADSLTAGGGKDIFGYTSAHDSTGPAYDTIANANLALDRFDVSAAAGAVLAINAAVTTGSLSTATFNTDLAADLPAAELGAHDAVLFTASAGTLSGDTFLVIDTNGAAGYQANADLVMRLTGATGTLTTATFI